MSEENSSKSHIIIELPGQISRSCCSKCGKDLDYILQAYLAGQIKPPAHCPGCGSPLRQDNMTRLVYRCSKCNEEVVDPQKEDYCTGCGRHFRKQTKTEA